MLPLFRAVIYIYEVLKLHAHVHGRARLIFPELDRSNLALKKHKNIPGTAIKLASKVLIFGKIYYPLCSTINEPICSLQQS